MSPGTVSVSAVAALLGIAPAALMSTLTRAGIKVGPRGQTSETDLARVFGRGVAREFVTRAKERGRS